MIITSSGLSMFPPFVLHSCVSLSGCGNGFAHLRLKGLQPQGSREVVLPGTCPKHISPTTKGPSLSRYSRIWERSLLLGPGYS